METDYRKIVAEIINRHISEETKSYLQKMGIRESITFFDGLADAFSVTVVSTNVKEVMTRDAILTEVCQVLRQFRVAWKERPEKSYALQILDKFCREQEQKYIQERKQRNYDGARCISQVISYLQHIFDVVSSISSPEIDNIWQVIKNIFDEDVEKMKEEVKRTSEICNVFFDFLHDFFRNYYGESYIYSKLVSDGCFLSFSLKFSQSSSNLALHEIRGMPCDDMKKMVFDLNYSDTFINNRKPEIKCDLMSQMFQEGIDRDGIIAYIKSNFEFLKFLIKTNKFELVEAVLKYSDFSILDKIDELLDYAITQEKHEIYVLLLNYKNANGGYTDISENFKL